MWAGRVDTARPAANVEESVMTQSNGQDQIEELTDPGGSGRSWIGREGRMSSIAKTAIGALFGVFLGVALIVGYLQLQPAAEPTDPVARRGRDVFLGAPCILCHTVRGTTAGGTVAPDLTHVASRRLIAAGTLPNTPGHLAGWITDSQEIKPGNRMPPIQIQPQDLQPLLAYLEALK